MSVFRSGESGLTIFCSNWDTGIAAILVPVLLVVSGCAAKLATPNLDPLGAVTTSEGARAWSYDLDHDGGPHCLEVDLDRDGVVDRFRFDTDRDGTLDLVTDRAGEPADSVRSLALFVDGVSIDDVEAMWAEGYFREFYPPGAMISPFPSMTYVSFSQMLGTPPPPGYEELYYEIERNALAGGVSEHLSTEQDGKSGESAKSETFLTAVGYKQPATYSGLVYVLPTYTMRKDLENVIQYFNSMGPGPAIAYVGTADGIAHKLGPSGTRELLIELDQICVN